MFLLGLINFGELIDGAQDGVLLRGNQVIPEARRALAILEGDNPFGMYVDIVKLLQYS
jgi:hypothetical protein